MKKIFLIAVLVVGSTLILISQNKTIYSGILSLGVEARMTNNRIEELGDGLHASLCGAGGPLPASHASGSCIAVVAGERLFIVDAGTNGARNLMLMGYPIGQIEALFLTHYHSDHIDGLGEMATLRWVSNANKKPLPVFGPEGLEDVVNGFNLAYSADFLHRHTHHGDDVAPMSGKGMIAKPFVTPPNNELMQLFLEEDLVIEAIRVDHGVVSPAVGYRFTYKDRSLVISGDTKQSDNILRFARGTDLLIHEALAPNLVGLMNSAAKKLNLPIPAKITTDILDYHASPIEAAETARDANVGHLLFYHIVPPLILPGQEALFLNGAEDIFSELTVGRDGTSFSMPSGSNEIILKRTGL